LAFPEITDCLIELLIDLLIEAGDLKPALNVDFDLRFVIDHGGIWRVW